MDYLEPQDSSKDLTKCGVRGVGSLIGGTALLLLKGLAGAFGGFLGVVVGGIAVIVGLSSIKSEAKADKTGGYIALAAGGLLAVTGLSHFKIPLISGLAALSSGLVGIGAVGLLGYGAWNLFKFIRGLKSRS